MVRVQNSRHQTQCIGARATEFWTFCTRTDLCFQCDWRCISKLSKVYSSEFIAKSAKSHSSLWKRCQILVWSNLRITVDILRVPACWGSITRIERELSRDAPTGIPCSHRKFWCEIQCQWPRGPGVAQKLPVHKEAAWESLESPNAVRTTTKGLQRIVNMRRCKLTGSLGLWCQVHKPFYFTFLLIERERQTTVYACVVCDSNCMCMYIYIYMYSKFIWNWCHVISNHTCHVNYLIMPCHIKSCLIMVHCIILC